MAKYELKTKPTTESVTAVIAKIKDDGRRRDCAALVKLMQAATGEKPKMWGPMIGFGEYHYEYPSGHSGDFFIVGFAARANALTLYLSINSHPALMERLGKYKRSKSCLYVKSLADLDLEVLRQLVSNSYTTTKAKYPPKPKTRAAAGR